MGPKKGTTRIVGASSPAMSDFLVSVANGASSSRKYSLFVSTTALTENNGPTKRNALIFDQKRPVSIIDQETDTVAHNLECPKGARLRAARG